jgi:hypothetical protein
LLITYYFFFFFLPLFFTGVHPLFLFKDLHNHTIFVTGFVTHFCSANILKGGNPVSASGAGSNVPLVAVDLVQESKSVKRSPRLNVATGPCELVDTSLKNIILIENKPFVHLSKISP